MPQLLFPLLLDKKYFWYIAVFTLLGDLVLTQLIIRYVPYTEIDFTTYMRHIDLYLEGERDYSLIKGPSGPLVYPAGHVLVHRVLHFATNGGTNIRRAQTIYSALYSLTQFLCFGLYYEAGNIPNWILPCLSLSKRLHSIYVLRLFNDCWAIISLFASVFAYCHDLPNLGSILFSTALSIKMNILLYLPGLLLMLFKSRGLLRTIYHLFVIIAVQLFIATPFLQNYPHQYLNNAFELSRVFLYKWTVNWRFVPEAFFLSRTFAITLLILHLGTLLLFLFVKWSRDEGGALHLIGRGLRGPARGAALAHVTPDEFITVLFTCNLIGVLFARSLHYQFYSWYAQQLPFLTWRTKYPVVVKLALLVFIEYAWNVFPSTNLSSSVLFLSHIVLLAGVWSGFPSGRTLPQADRKEL